MKNTLYGSRPDSASLWRRACFKLVQHDSHGVDVRLCVYTANHEYLSTSLKQRKCCKQILDAEAFSDVQANEKEAVS